MGAPKKLPIKQLLVAKEEHYDAENVHRYTLQNTYDSQERLISKTDPLGHTTTFHYDTLSNLITQEGLGQRKEWQYDAASRPIQEKERQTDGTFLTRHKTYDPLGQRLPQPMRVNTSPTTPTTPLAMSPRSTTPMGARKPKGTIP